jgi:hypothetical protein
MAKNTKKAKKRAKPKKDENQMAYDVLKSVPSARSEAARILGSLGASKGGHARKAKLSPEELTEIGKKGSNARWGKPTGIAIVPPIKKD